MKEELLRFTNLSVASASGFALRDIDFNLFKGEFLVVTGLNSTGKTTLAKVISGQTPFAADVIIKDEKRLDGFRKYQRLNKDIRYIAESVAQLEGFTAAQYVMGLENAPLLSVYNAAQAETATNECFERLGVNLSARAEVASLSTPERHLMTIAKSIAAGARVIVLDSVANQYTAEDFDTLAGVLERLRHNWPQVTVAYFTNRQDPLVALADRIVIMRGNTLVSVLHKDGFSAEQLAAFTLGYTVEAPQAEPVRRMGSPGQPALSIACRIGDVPVDITVKSGEICVATTRDSALVSALVRHLLAKKKAGVAVDGVEVGSYKQSVRRGMAVVPHTAQGNLFPNLDRRMNLSLQVAAKTSRLGVLNSKVMHYVENEYSKGLEPAARPDEYEVVLYRWMAANVKVVVLEEPAVDMDVLVRGRFYETLGRMAQKGIAVLIVTNHGESYQQISDRIVSFG